MPSVRGRFDVALAPQTTSEIGERAGMARLTLDKRFHGALDAVSQGEMLAIREPSSGMGVYVALERARGTLDGRAGSFVLAHLGTMTRDGQQLRLIVVPESGTDELSGLTGEMRIIIENKEHFYELDYALDGSAAPAPSAN